MGSEGGGACSVHPMCPTNLFNEELLAHGDALVETLLEALQHLLLLFHLPPQVAVRLQHHKLLVHRGLPRQLPQRIRLDLIANSIGPQKTCASARASGLPSGGHLSAPLSSPGRSACSSPAPSASAVSAQTLARTAKTRRSRSVRFSSVIAAS